MTFSSGALACAPSVQQRQGHTEAVRRLQDPGGDVNAVWRHPEGPEWHFTKTHPGQMNPPHTALTRPPGHPDLALQCWPDPMSYYSSRSARPSNWPEECSGSLEPPLPLLSDVNCNHNVPVRHPAAFRPRLCKTRTHMHISYGVEMIVQQSVHEMIRGADVENHWMLPPCFHTGSSPEQRHPGCHLPPNPLQHKCSCHDRQNYPVNVHHTPGAHRPSEYENVSVMFSLLLFFF